MSKLEMANWKTGTFFGFYTYMILLFINYIFLHINGKEPMPSILIFWAGLIVAFGYEFILNRRAKNKAKK
ncbi:putative neutral ceramidase superfamily lipid hydrolase [Metabacillus malikii]|uniref:Neutral ceramidase superfamily lipid hydrolase n=2 Tax=Metabacillus malikii TaxID=1504265 RepID=A0ABT9ZLV9_9BACI|nr:putative neutral ceramidase superfamily lipid hydrolase [Metabacillus malikii]